MADVAEKEKGYGSDIDSQQQLYERPKGLKGLYLHPVTQVRSQVASESVLTCANGGQVVMLALICFMCPGFFFIPYLRR